MKPVTVKFSHWIPKLFRMGATTIGHTIYFAGPKESVSLTLFKHEVTHVHQAEMAGGTIPFLLTYFWQWVGAGFRYSKIPMEISAYAQQNDPLTAEEFREWQRWFA